MHTRLYNSCPWEDRAVRKLIADGKIAARLKGFEYRSNSQQECPICFLYYDEVNITTCCNANICSECFLQVRPQKEKQPSCPFCSAQKFTVAVAPKPSEMEIATQQKEEQKVIEARIRAEQKDANNTDDSPKGNKKKSAVAPDSTGDRFGSQLEKDERFQLLKMRTESFASAEEGTRTPQKDAESIKSIAMTPEERRRLEDEMRAQHAHPLSLRVEAEAHERRLQNEQAYYRSNSAGGSALRSQRATDFFRSNSSNMASATRRLRHRGARDWNQIVESFENDGAMNSLDDLVVLEAAILLSMEEEARQGREGDTSAQQSSLDGARNEGGRISMARSMFGVTNDTQTSAPTARATSSMSTSEGARAAVGSLRESRRRLQLARAAGLNSSSRRRAVPDAALDTASLMMRGISEEEQIAMAIAASLQDQSTENGDTDEANDGESEENNSLSSPENGSEDNNLSSTGNSNTVIEPSNSTVTDRRQEIGIGATTISDLARVVTDSGRQDHFAIIDSENRTVSDQQRPGASEDSAT